MNFVVARRLEKWADAESRAEAAWMLAEGASLAEVLLRYPEGVPREFGGKPVEPARRAIYAHYALLQEQQGEPDADPADGVTVERIIRKEGIERARERAAFLGSTGTTGPACAGIAARRRRAGPPNSRGAESGTCTRTVGIAVSAGLRRPS